MYFIFIGEFGLVTFTSITLLLTFFFILNPLFFFSNSQLLCPKLSDLFKEDGPQSLTDSLNVLSLLQFPSFY